MLDFLVQTGDIHKRDGLLATWVHAANSKEEMDKALTGKSTHVLHKPVGFTLMVLFVPI